MTSSTKQRSRLTVVVEDSLPAGTIVGTTGLIPDEKVEFIHKLILDSGVPQQIDGWDAEDNFGRHAGGRPRGMSTLSLLTIALLCTTEGGSQEVEEVARVVHERLSDEALQLLGLSTKKRATVANWYPLVRNAFDRMLKPLDSHPGARKKYPTKAEYDATLAARDPEEMEQKQRRLDWVANSLLLATKNVLPEEVWASWHGDLTVDATVVPAYGKKGAPYQGADIQDDARLLPVEPDAGWYLRNGNHEVVKLMKSAKKAVYGWELTLTAMANHDPNSVSPHPLLVLGIGMTRPSKDLISTALNTIEFIALCGHPIGRLTGDRGYMASAKADDLSIPLRLLGYDIVTDYKVDQLGSRGGGFAGALMVEGAFYCPSMPKNLVEATVQFRNGKISWDTWDKRVEQRKQYRLRPAEKTDDKGRTPMMCPARGSGATAICPLANPQAWESKERTYDATKTEIVNPPAANKCGDICKNKKSVSFPMEAGAKFWQTHHFGSKEWREIYRTDRSTIEGINGALKTATIPIDDATKRRRRGYTAQYLLLTMLVATENLARIQSFRDALVAHPTEEAYARHVAKKLARKVNRKAQEAHRANSWDAFQKQSADQREANARVVRGTR